MNPQDKGTFKRRKHLRKDAIPTLFDIPNSPRPRIERRLLKRCVENSSHAQYKRQKLRNPQLNVIHLTTLHNRAHRKRSSYGASLQCIVRVSSLRKSLKISDIEAAMNVIAEHLSGNAYNIVVALCR